MTPEQALRRLFTSDTDAPDYHERNRGCGRLLGWRPWWPSPAELWQVGEQCPDTFPSADSWAEAWRVLDELHQQYEQHIGDSRHEQ